MSLHRFAHLAESARHHATRGSTAHDDKVVLPVRERFGHGTAARVLDIALRPDKHFQQAHEQHERRPAARAGQRRTRLGHRTIAVATHSGGAFRI